MDFLDDSWLSVNEFILYGFGEKLAVPIIDELLKKIRITKIIDNNEAKWGVYKGIPIVGSEDLSHEEKNHKIVVALSDVWYPEVVEQLTKMGRQENLDFCHIKIFFHDYFYAKFRCNSLFFVQTILTSECTLNCEKCAYFIPYFQDSWIYDCTQLKKDYDLLFHYIDYVPFISLLGGETLLYKELKAVIDYLFSNYSHQYGTILITTNGMIMPDTSLLESLKKANVTVNISNYTAVINYKNRLKEVCNVLEKYKIHYSLHTFPASWNDLGFPRRGSAPAYTSSSVREHMLLCNPDCSGYYNGKLYYCDTSWSADKCGLFSLAPDDYLDLKTIQLCEKDKRKIAQFSLGFFENKEYMSMCAVCNGNGPDNPLKVCPGIQKPRTSEPVIFPDDHTM